MSPEQPLVPLSRQPALVSPNTSTCDQGASELMRSCRPHHSRPLNLATAALALAFAFWATPSRAQGREDEKPTNLKILPADISREDLRAVMGGFSSALGVRCDHCHVVDGQKRDFASDEKEHKRAARGMMLLTKSINDSLAKAIGRGR